MSSYEDPLLEKTDDLTFGVYEGEDGLETWWKSPIEQTYDPKTHNHDGEIVTRGTYTLGPRRSDLFINDALSSTGIRAVHGGEIGTKEGVHIHAHGFNTDQQSASDEFSKITQNFSHSQIEHIGYNWDSFAPDTVPTSRDMVLDEEWQEKVYGETIKKVEWKTDEDTTPEGRAWNLATDAYDIWKSTRLIARENGKRLATFIIDLLTGSPRGEEPNVFLTGYSLGAQVVLSAVRHLADYYDDPAFTSNGGILSGVYLVGPAVPSIALSTDEDDTWTEPGDYADIYKPEKEEPFTRDPYGKNLQAIVKDKPHGNIHVAWSSSDTTLSRVYRLGNSIRALGAVGPIYTSNSFRTPRIKTLPPTLTDKNYADDWESWTTLKTYYSDFHKLWLDHETVWENIEKKMKQSNDLYGPDPDALAASATIRRIDLEDSSSKNGPGLTFSGEGSTATESSIYQYTWDFDRDHGIDKEVGPTVHVPRSQIDDTGVYEVRLTVRDTEENTDSVVRSYRVPPQFLHGDRLEAVVDVEPYPDPELADELYPSPDTDPQLDSDLIESESETEVTLDSEEFEDIVGGIRFDPTGSTVADTPIKSLDWDFQGIDPSTSLDDDGILRVPMSEFPNSGEYEVTLTVTDESGGSDSTTETYTVEEEWFEGGTSQLDGTYQIENVNSGKQMCTLQKFGIPMVVQDDRSALWRVEQVTEGEYKLTHKDTDKVLAAFTWEGDVLDDVEVESWSNEAYQRWKITEGDEAYRLENVARGTVLQVQFGGTDNWDEIDLDVDGNQSHQRWRLKQPDD